LDGYYKFVEKFRNLIDFIDNNYYCISKDSLIDFSTYKQIFNLPKYKHTFIKNNFISNIDDDIINTQEKIINSEKAKKYFNEKIKCEIKFNYLVVDLKQINNKVIINDDITCDLLIDCSEEKITLCATSQETGKMMVDINIDDLDEFAINDGETISLSFGLKYLHNI
jgi:hypothetical protein